MFNLAFSSLSPVVNVFCAEYANGIFNGEMSKVAYVEAIDKTACVLGCSAEDVKASLPTGKVFNTNGENQTFEFDFAKEENPGWVNPYPQIGWPK